MKGDDDLRDRASPELAQPSRRIIQSMTQEPGLGQDHSLASALKPIIPQRITRSRAHMMGTTNFFFCNFSILGYHS